MSPCRRHTLGPKAVVLYRFLEAQILGLVMQGGSIIGSLRREWPPTLHCCLENLHDRNLATVQMVTKNRHTEVYFSMHARDATIHWKSWISMQALTPKPMSWLGNLSFPAIMDFGAVISNDNRFSPKCRDRLATQDTCLEKIKKYAWLKMELGRGVCGRCLVNFMGTKADHPSQWPAFGAVEGSVISKADGS